MAGGKNKVIRILSAKERGLFNAINSEDVMAAKQLVEDDGVDVNVQDVFQRTPMIRACMLSDQEAQVAIVTLLLEKEGDVNLKDNHGRTALMVLCKEGPRALTVMKMIMKWKADPNIQDDNGDTALMHAVQVDNLDAVQILLNHGMIDTELKNSEGDYPLLLAAKQQNAEICSIMVKEGRADHSDIPLFLRKYLPPECQETDFTKDRHDRFEEYRKNAQGLPGTPYNPEMDEPNVEDTKQGPKNNGEKWKKAALNVKTANAFEGALKEAAYHKAGEQAKAKEEATREEAEAREEAKAKEEAEAKEKAEAKAKPKEEEAKAKAAEMEKTTEQQTPKNPLPSSRPLSRPPSLRERPVSGKEDKELQHHHTVQHNTVKRGKTDLKTYKTKSGRTIYPNAPHDREYDNISEIRDGRNPAPKRRGKGKDGSLLPAIVAIKKRTPILTT